jgi:hypothetical protein
MPKTLTLAALIAEVYTADEPKFFVLCDSGSGSAFGEAGQTLDCDDAAAEKYGNLIMVPTLPHKTNDGLEAIYASEWIDGDNGYRYQVRF